MEISEPVELRRHRLTVDQYFRMAEIGVLGPEDHVELIGGEVIDLAPQSPPHVATVNRLGHQLVPAVNDRAIVSIHNPLRLGLYDEPKPDVALLKPQADFYESAPYTAADTLLVIEVADTTLAYDTRLKARLYAAYGVAAYWVVDLKNRSLICYTQPRGERFVSAQTLTELGMIDLPGLDGLQADLSGLF
jgi:Uma2 family endonuclease